MIIDHPAVHFTAGTAAEDKAVYRILQIIGSFRPAAAGAEKDPGTVLTRLFYRILCGLRHNALLSAVQSIVDIQKQILLDHRFRRFTPVP